MNCIPFGKQASRSSCNSKAFTVLCSSASCRNTASYWEKPLPSSGGALTIADFIKDGGVSNNLKHQKKNAKHKYKAKFYQSFLNSKRKTYLNLIIEKPEILCISNFKYKLFNDKIYIIYNHKNFKMKEGNLLNKYSDKNNYFANKIDLLHFTKKCILWRHDLMRSLKYGRKKMLKS